jgi:glycosyltransferase involved in cell wall biosynthesis
VTIVHLVIGGEVAGGQIVAARLARAAREAGHRVSFLSPGKGAFVDRMRAEGYEVDVLRLGGALDVRALLRLRRALRRRGADVLHTHVHFSLNVLGRLAGRLAGAAVVSHVHIENVFRADGLGRPAQRALDRATARLCARILAVSEATRDAVVADGYPRSRIEVVPNGVDLVRAEPERLEGLPLDTPVVIEVARLAPVKGQRELIRALARVPEAVLVLVGVAFESDGAYRDELAQEARAAGVDGRVVFAGYRPDAQALVAGADVFVLPSHAEGMPITILEAMAQERPVVATRVGGSAEVVVDGETGLLVPPGDEEALAAALQDLLGDAELRRRLGTAGRRRVEEHFSAEEMAARVLAVYDVIHPTMAT